MTVRCFLSQVSKVREASHRFYNYRGYYSDYKQLRCFPANCVEHLCSQPKLSLRGEAEAISP